jgi:O-antigen/teichoic acid export membrane protein
LSTLKKLAGQTAIYGLSSIVGRMLNVLLVPIYTRVFLTGEYGVVTAVYSYVAFLNILFTYGLETAFFRFYQNESDRQKLYSTSLISIVGSSVFLAGMMILFSSPLAAFASGKDGTVPFAPQYISWFAIVIAADAISAIPFAKLRQENKALRFASIKFFVIVVNVLLNVFFLLYCPAQLKNHPGSWAASLYHPEFGVSYVFVINVATSLLTLVLLSPELLRLRFTFDTALWKQLIIYAIPLMIAGFAGMVNETFDRIMLPYLIADKNSAMDQLGIYGACYKLSILMTLFVQTFRFAAEPFFFSHASRENARETYATVMHYFVMFCAFIFLGVMMYIDVIKHFIGKDFYSGLKVVPILLIANLCLGVFYNLSIWYKLSGKTHWGAWLSLIGAAITLLLNFLLIPLMGYMGAAWATLACYAGMMIISYYAGQRYYTVPYNVRSFLALVFSALAFYGVSVAIRLGAGFSDTSMLVVNTILLLAYAGGVFYYETRKNSYLRLLLFSKNKDADKNH